MSRILAAATLGAGALVAYHHAVWPLLLSRMRRRASPAAPERGDLPHVSVVMPAFNEAGFIAEKVRNLAALDYPADLLHVTIACDGCTDGTPALARAALAEHACRRLNAEVLDFRPNRGKTALLNRCIAASPPGIVALTDVSAMLPPDALRRTARHYADPSVGAVGGTYRLACPGSAGEAAYWRYQTAVKQGEAALGAPLGMHGAFWTFRREAWEPLPPDIINDDFVMPLLMLRRGWQLRYDETIAAVEAERSDPCQDAARRRRIAAGNAQQLARMTWLLSPRRGGVALAFASGKALRVLAPFLILFAAAGSAALAPSSRLFSLLCACEAVCVLAAMAGAALGPAAPKLLAAAAYAANGHVASLLGVLRYMAGRERRPWGRAGRPALNNGRS